VDISRPADLQRLQQLFPEYYDKRVQTVKNWGDIQTKLALIRVRGWQNREDFVLWTAYVSGQIKVPTEAAFAYTGESNTLRQFKRGKWNPMNRIPQPGKQMGGRSNLEFSDSDMYKKNWITNANNKYRFGPNVSAQGTGNWSGSNTGIMFPVVEEMEE